MSKYKDFRNTMWRRLARRSFRAAAKGGQSQAWTGVGIFASTMHVLQSTNARKKRVLWRGRIEAGERIVIDNKVGRDIPSVTTESNGE